MKSNTYSTYEAKAKFSEVLRKVGRNKTVVVTSRGKPIARIIPYEKSEETLEQRLLRLESQGVVSGDSGARDWFETVEKKPGSLKGFLGQRGFK